MKHRGLLLIILATCVALLLSSCGDSEGDVVLDTSSTSADAVTEDDPETTVPETTEPDDAAEPDDVGTETTEVVEDTAPTTTAPQDSQGTTLTDEASISTLGLGPVYMGDTLAEVAEKIGVELVPDNFGSDSCRYHMAPGGPPGVAFMVAFDRIARIDIDDPSIITTRSGAGIGSTKQQILDLFGDKIVESPHPYSDGQYLTFVPVDDKDSNLRIIFETNTEGVVVTYRTGQLPEVEWIEGCS